MEEEIDDEKLKEALKSAFKEMFAQFPVQHQKKLEKIDFDALVTEIKKINHQIEFVKSQNPQNPELAIFKILNEVEPFKKGLVQAKKWKTYYDKLLSEKSFSKTKLPEYLQLIDMYVEDAFKKNIQLTNIRSKKAGLVNLFLNYRKTKGVDKLLDSRNKNFQEKFNFIKDWSVIYENSLEEFIIGLYATSNKQISFEELEKKKLSEKIKIINNEYPQYASLVASFDIDLRNTLAHNYPRINYFSKQIEYKKKSKTFNELTTYMKELLALTLIISSIKSRYVIIGLKKIEDIQKKQIFYKQ